MIKTDILKKALLDSTLKEIQAIEALDYPKIKTDNEYDKKIYSVINNSQVKRIHYSKRVAIVIAAILVCLSMMMSISAIRVKVIDFVVSIYEKFICLSIDEPQIDSPKTIEGVYLPSYIPEKYIKTSLTTDVFTTKAVYMHNNFDIRYYQNIISNTTDSYFDSENSEYTIKFIDSMKVYYMLKNNRYTIRWIYDEYSFMLSCPESLEWEEIEKIIMSVEKVSNE